MGGGKESTSTSTTTIPPEVLARYNAVNKRAEQAAQTPFQQYSTDPNAFVAPLNSTQQSGIANTNAFANQAQPYYQGATGMTLAGSQNANLGGLNTNQYLSPYLNTVVQNTANQLQNQNQQQSSALKGNAIMAGAFGGDRAGIAQGNLANQQSLANAQTLSGLLNTGYQQAQGVAQQQQGAQLSADQANLARYMAGGQQLAGIGNQAQTSALQGASAQLTAGQAQQQTEQAGKTALYNQFLQQQSYPFQVSQFLANIAEGTGALSGSSTSTTGPAPFFSDSRLKEDIEPIGKTFDGQNIVKFKYKGKPETHMGLIAQEVEKKHPKAVGLAAGYRTVDYDEATRDAADRGHFGAGGLVPHAYASGGSPTIDTTGDSPYGGASRFDIQPLVIRHLLKSDPVKGPPQTQDELAQLSGLINSGKSLYGDANAVYNAVSGTGKKDGGRIEKSVGGGLYSQLTGGAPAGENTPDYSSMVGAPSAVPDVGGAEAIKKILGAGDHANANASSASSSSWSPNSNNMSPDTPAANFGSSSEPTHGGMGGGSHLNTGGRAGFADGGLPYEDDQTDLEDLTKPKSKPMGLSIPEQPNTHGLMSSQNPTGAPTSGIGGISGAVNTAKDIYGLGKDIYSLGKGAAGLAGLGSAASGLGTAGAAGTAAAGLGAGAAAAGGGGGFLSALLGFLPFLARGGSVDRKHYDGGGTVDDPNDPNNPDNVGMHDMFMGPQDPKPTVPVVVAPAEAKKEEAAPVASAATDQVPPARTSHAIAEDVINSLGANKNASPADVTGSVPSPNDTTPGLVPPLAPMVKLASVGRPHPIIGEDSAKPAQTSAEQDQNPSPVPSGGLVPRGVSTQGTQDAGSSANSPFMPLFQKASAGTGISPDYLARSAWIESKNNPNAYNKGSQADGLFQFVPGTARDYNLSNPQDPVAATNAAIQLAQNNKAELTKALGRPPTDAELYLAHQQGAGGASGLLSNPSAPASSIVGAKAVLSNGGNLNMTAGQFASLWLNKYNGTSVGSSGGGSGGLNPGGYTEGTPSAGGVAPANAGTNAVGGIQPEGQGGISGWASNPDNRNLLLSVLSGLGGMAGSNSRYLGAAMLQGLGAGANTYAGLQKQAADIGRTHADTVRTQQEANLTAAATGQTKQETTNLRGAQYQRVVIPNDGTYVLDKSNPTSGLVKVADAQGRPIAGVSPELQNAATTAPLASSTGVVPPAASPVAAPSGANTTPQPAAGPQDLRPASVNPTSWTAATSPPDDYQPGVQARYANYASDPANGAQIRQTAIQDAAKQHDAASAAAQTQQNLSSMKDAYQNLSPNQAGPLHEAYMKVGGQLNAYTNAIGLGNVVDPQALASGQEVDKLHGALASSMGGTKGAQLFADVSASVPGGSNTPLGFARVTASVNQLAQRTRDQSAYMDNYANKFGTLNGAQEAFDAQNPPEAYAAKAVLDSVPPAAVQQLQAYVKQNPGSAKAAMQNFDKTFGRGTSGLVLGISDGH